ncbi:MAG: DUF2007 domain-containing protein [Hyphomicrobium sp.]
MRDLLATHDPVVISYATTLLKSEGIENAVLDQNISIMQGWLGIFTPRIAVSDDDWCDAARMLEDAGLGAWIMRDG